MTSGPTLAVLRWMYDGHPEMCQLPDGARGMKTNAAAVLSYLAFRANAAYVAWPTWPEIQDATGLGKSALALTMTALTEAGVVSSARVNFGRKRTANLYYINHPDAPHFALDDTELHARYLAAGMPVARVRTAVSHRPHAPADPVDDEDAPPVDNDDSARNVRLATSVERTYPVTSVERTYPVTSVERTYPYRTVLLEPSIQSVHRGHPGRVPHLRLVPPVDDSTCRGGE